MSELSIPFEAFEKPVVFADLIGDDETVAAGSESPQMKSPSYELAFKDEKFIMSDVARSTRIQMEMDKPEWVLRQYNIRSTVIVFGSARFISRNRAERLLNEARVAGGDLTKAKLQLKTSEYYELARSFARIVSEDMKKRPAPFDYVICTGGGPGIMEAANRGANEAGAQSIGFNIKLPYEQKPNPYTSPHLCFQFHYFSVRKLHFMLRAKALVACAGGFGTFDELFEAFTLRQTQRMQMIPIVLLGTEFWNTCINFKYLVETGVINSEDLKLFHMTDSPQEAWNIIKDFYRD